MQKPVHQKQLSGSALYSSLLESLPLNVYAKGLGGHFLYANSQYCQKCGLTLSDLIGKDDFDLHPKDLAEKYRRDDERIMASGQVENLEEEWEAQEADAPSGWVHVIKAPLYAPGEQDVIGTIGIFWDISEKKFGEIVLHQERNLLRTVIDNLPDFIYVKDRQSRFLLGNDAVARFMGVDSPDALLGKTDKDFYEEILAEKFAEDEIRVLQNGKPDINIEESITAPSGEIRSLLTSKLPMKNIEDDIVGIIGIGHDVTELRKKEQETLRLERQLQHAQRMETIGALTAGIAHDFNNLLSVINGYTELMQLTTPQDSQNQENLSRVLTAGRSAAKLVGKLLAFSREQAAQAKVIYLSSEIVQNRPKIEGMLGHSITVSLKVEKNIWPIRIDPAQLKQVIEHMVNNARDAMPNGGDFTIQARNFHLSDDAKPKYPSLAPGEWVELILRDSGTGMPSDVQNHVFEPFFSTKQTKQRKGLGLATVFGIIKQNKGHIFVDSSVGEGAAFSIYLPKVEMNEPIDDVRDSNSADEVAARQRDEVILIVEDDQAVQSFARTILSNEGYVTYTASNGAEALLLIEQKRNEIKLLITNVVMPGINGKVLFDEIQRRKLQIKVLFMSGHSSDTLAQYGVVPAQNRFLQKPFNSDQLVATVDSVLSE